MSWPGSENVNCRVKEKMAAKAGKSPGGVGVPAGGAWGSGGDVPDPDNKKTTANANYGKTCVTQKKKNPGGKGITPKSPRSKNREFSSLSSRKKY